MNAVTWEDTRDIPLHELTTFAGNARRGDIEAIAESLHTLGQYRSLVVRRTGDGLVILAGNHTYRALTAEQECDRDGCKAPRTGTARCEIITCDDATAKRINLADNRLPELGTYDDDALAKLLVGLDGDLAGTGYTDEDLTEILAANDDLPDGDSDEESSRSDGSLLALLDTSIGDPRHQVHTGQVWELGHHVLLVADVMTDWPSWKPLLSEGKLFAPYPGVYLPLTTRAQEIPLVMVQPDTYIAGHILDKWDTMSEASPVLRETP